MSIRYGILALLDAGQKYGYQLRAEFERATGGTWALNIGQVYTTLSRLERDGLVEGAGSDDSGRVMYQITESGHDDVRQWFATPVGRDARPRNELAIKLALALTVPGADVSRIVQTQRTSTTRELQGYTRLKRDAGDDISWLLVLESMIFQAEAEIRWLDHCETALTRQNNQTWRTASTPIDEPDPEHDEEVTR